MARMVNKSVQCGQEFLVTTGYDVLGKSMHLIHIVELYANTPVRTDTDEPQAWGSKPGPIEGSGSAPVHPRDSLSTLSRRLS